MRPQGEKDRWGGQALASTHLLTPDSSPALPFSPPRQQLLHFLLKCLSHFHPLLWPPILKPRAHLSLACIDQSCPTLCNPMDCSPPGSSVHGIFQARILDGLPFHTPGDLLDPGMKPMSPESPVLRGGYFTTEPPGEPFVWRE